MYNYISAKIGLDAFSQEPFKPKNNISINTVSH